MTKILVISDSHGHLGKIYDTLRLFNGRFDILVHLGDRAKDIFPFIDNFYLDRRVILINGNSDNERVGVDELVKEIDGVRVFMTHGHLYEVHKGLDKLKKKAKKEKVMLVLYGHEHKPFKEIIDGILFFSPGALRDDLFGFLTLDSGFIKEAKVLRL